MDLLLGDCRAQKEHVVVPLPFGLLALASIKALLEPGVPLLLHLLELVADILPGCSARTWQAAFSRLGFCSSSLGLGFTFANAFQDTLSGDSFGFGGLWFGRPFQLGYPYLLRALLSQV